MSLLKLLYIMVCLSSLFLGCVFNLVFALGRRNWNIPKHLARFEFTPTSSGGTRIEVFPPSPATDDEKPFFAATSHPMRFAPSFYYKTAWSPLDLALYQPPLPSLQNLELSEVPYGVNPKSLAGTTEWCSILSEIR